MHAPGTDQLLPPRSAPPRPRASSGPPQGSSAVPPQPGCAAGPTAPGRLLVLDGRLDVHEAADVRMLLVEAVAAGTGELVVDLSAVTALDATGLGVLVGAHRRAQRAGRLLVLRDVPPVVARLLLLTRLDRVLRTVRTSAAG